MRDFGLSLQDHPDMGVMEPLAKLNYAGQYSTENLAKNVLFYLSEQINNVLVQELHSDPSSDTSDLTKQQANVRAVLKTFWPNIDKSYANMLFIWPTIDARAKGRSARSATKIGKAIRRMFPVLTDIEVEAITDCVKHKFFTTEWTIHSGSDAIAFKHAYASPYAETRNFQTTYSKKRLPDSCMRYSFDHLAKHPVEAYASGDFEIFWTENPEGKIGSRCLVSIAKEGERYAEAGPIYAVCDDSYDVLRRHVEPLVHHAIADYHWRGCKILSIPKHNNGQKESWIAPYIDLDPKSLTDTGDGYLMITECGEITGSNYGGLQYLEHRHQCSVCGDGLDEDDVYTGPDDGEIYCHDHYWDRYTTCDNCQEDVLSEDVVQVLVTTRWSQRESQWWCNECAEDNAVDCNGELWDELSCTLLADGSYFPKVNLDGNYFQCIIDSEWYPLEECNVTVDGELLHPDNIQDFNYEADRDGTARYVFDSIKSEWYLEENEGGLEREA